MRRTTVFALAGLMLVLGACGDDSAGSNNTTVCDPTCDANAVCEDVMGTATCVCIDGYAGDGLACADVDECTGGTDDCDANGTCANTDGSYTCTCNDGYQGDGTSCYDVDECTEGTAGCDANATCTNTVGSVTCTCNVGYQGDGTTCADVDECTDGTDSCDANATCANTVGSYTCTCNTGYQGDGATCYDVDECTTAGHNCDGNALCTNTVGGFTCACNAPYVGDGTACVLPTDCTSDPSICAADATCTSQGTFSICLCNTGYAGDGLTCADVDECTDGTHTCDTNATCANTTGSFTCTCAAGYTGNGTTCTDIDECTGGTHNCDTNATCTNTPGAFDCDCNTGYAGTGDVCFDIDECLEGLDNCDAYATCTNQLASFSCACPFGSIDVNSDGTVCSFYETCWDIQLNLGTGLPNGPYTIDPDGAGVGLDPFVVYCDMSTRGGGWTIVYAATGADGEEPMVSDTAVAGDAFTAHFNLNRAQKMAVAALSANSIFVRTGGGAWMIADSALFDGTLDTTDSEAHYTVNLRSDDGVTAVGEMGWSNYNISGGGDYHVSTGPVDHHSANYWVLNSGCVNQYLYSYSNTNADGDAGYDVNTGLGNWTPTTGCQGAEGGLLAFYAAMRPQITYEELDIGSHVSNYSAPRGYFFTAPVDMVITGIRVPEDASTAAQTMQLIRFNSGAPTGQTSDYVTEAYVNGLAGNVWYPVYVTVSAGEAIGLLGTRGGISSYGATDYVSSIGGTPVTLYRMYYNGANFETTGAENITASVGFSIARTEMEFYLP